MTIDGTIERYKLFAEWRDFGASTPPPGECGDNSALESPVHGIDHQPGFAVGNPHRAARSDDGPFNSDRVDQIEILRAERSAIRKFDCDGNIGIFCLILLHEMSFLSA